MRTVIIGLMASCLILVGCIDGFPEHVSGTAVAVETYSVDLRLKDGTIHHYEFWHFTSPKIPSLIKVGDKVELACKGCDGDMGYFGSIRVNGGVTP